MVRRIAFVSGVAAGVALLLFVLAGLASSSLSAPIRSAQSLTLDVHEGDGTIVGHPTDSRGNSLGPGDAMDPDDGTQMDLEGDEVTPAVATYKFDAQGNIYETHAPHTEVPHLGSPVL